MTTSATLTEGDVFIDTFKTGLLSRVAHDLRLRVTRFEVRVETTTGTVTATFDPYSLTVVGILRRGQLDAASPTDADRRTIERTALHEVLQVERHRRLEFAGVARDEPGGLVLDGTLHLAGQTQPVDWRMRSHRGRLSGSVELEPSRWGIPPYKAFLGTIQLQDRVIVHLDLPDPR